MTLPDWLADPALRPLWEAAAARLERHRLEPAGRVHLTGLDRTGRHALAAVLGHPVVSDRISVELTELDTLVRQRAGLAGLRQAAEAALGRTLRDRAAERSAREAARQAPYAAARAWLEAHPDLGWAEQWLVALRRSGLLTRTDNPTRQVVAALEILADRTVAEPGPVSRTELAARHAADAHALDDGQPLSQLVLRGLAAVAGTDPPVSAGARRALWERYAVSADAVSTTCLTLGIRPGGNPTHLTAWDLRQAAVVVPPEATVLVCENPRVLEAFAERYGAAARVVCTMGEPNLVTVEVLRAIDACEPLLRYHGDFDWPGLAIAKRLMRTIRIQPWRMTASHYLAAARRDGPSLVGSAVSATWDSGLTEAMARRGVAVHEEAVLDELLDSPPWQVG